MSARIGWGLALAALIAGYSLGGWHGVVLAFTLIVFWLLMQFNQAMRVMRRASQSPPGQVQSAVMFHAKLHAGMRLLDVVSLARSLGEEAAEQDAETQTGAECYVWHDDSGGRVHTRFVNGRLRQWRLDRAA